MIEVIGEIGVNHNGDFFTACKLVDAAIEAGCTSVKTQLWDTERVYPRERWDEMKKLELSRKDIIGLKGFCRGRGIELIVTPDDTIDAQFIAEIGFKRIKTSSMSVTNLPLLKYIGTLGMPVIFSTGACNWSEFNAAYSAIGRNDTTVLHCVSAYPAPLEQMNMRVLLEMRDMIFRRSPIGLSDHTLGTEAAIMALAMEATVFEKHLTLSRDQEGPDHQASLTPPEMWQYVQTLKECDAAMGEGHKRVMPCEIENRKKFDKFNGGTNGKADNPNNEGAPQEA